MHFQDLIMPQADALAYMKERHAEMIIARQEIRAIETLFKQAYDQAREVRIQADQDFNDEMVVSANIESGADNGIADVPDVLDEMQANARTQSYMANDRS